MNATPVCFNALARAMPHLRAETARRLVQEGLQQGRVAEHLGVSQAMVSKYLRRPPRHERILPPAAVDRLVDASVRYALTQESKGLVPEWCPLCVNLCEQGFACSETAGGLGAECLRQDEPRTRERASAVLENLQAAEARLRKLPFRLLMPEVRSNLAMSLAEPRDSRDVAAFPGRLVQIHGEVKAASAPELGSSSHLADVLLKARRNQPTHRAILNTRHDERVRRAARHAGLRLSVMKRTRNDLVVRLPPAPEVDGLVDPGAFGVEPALYLLGRNALEVVAKAQRLLIVLDREVNA